MSAIAQPALDPVTMLERQMAGMFLDRMAISACLLDPMPDGSLRFIVANRAMEEVFQSEGKLAGRGVDEVLPLPAADALRRRCRHCVRTWSPVEWDGRLTIAGRSRWWRTLMVPLGGRRGRIAGILVTACDIAQHKAEQAALRGERDRLQDAIESINEGFALWDADDRLIFANGRYIGFYDMVAPLFRSGESYETLLRAAVAAGQFRTDAGDGDWLGKRLQARRRGDFACEELLHDGRWLLATERHTSDGGTVGLRTEITERKRLEHVVRQSRASLQAMIDSVDELIAMLNADAVVLAINRFGAACFGLQPSSVVGRSLLHLVQPAEAEILSDLIGAVIEKGTRVQREFPWRGRFMDVSAHPVFDGNGRPSAVSMFSRDVTERRLAEDALRMLTSAVEQSPVILMITSPDDIIEYVNPKFCEVTGYTAEEVVGRSPALLKSGDMSPEAYAHMWATMKDGCTWSGKFRNRRKSGELFWVSASISPVKNTAGEITHYIGLQEDITERIAAEEEARDHQQQMMRYMRIAAMGEMAAALAHELNQPIAAVVNYCNGSLRRLMAETCDTGEVIAALKDAHSEAQRAKTIIQHVARFVRKTPQQRTTQCLNALIRSVVALARRELERHEVDVILDLCNDLPPVTVNLVEIEQVLLNLLRNSLEAMADAEKEARTLRLRTGMFAPNSLIVTVSDNGRGFDPESEDRMFDPFFTTKPQGMGMGLAICRNVIEAHAGRIWAEVNSDGGASVHFTLPAPEADSAGP